MSENSSRFLSKALRRLWMVLGGVLLFLVLGSLACVWALGRFAPSIIDSTLESKAGAHVSVDANESNLFTGKLVFSGVTLWNPSRWTVRSGGKIKRLALDFDPWTWWGSGTKIIREADIDIETLVIVGKADWLKDNNIQDISHGLKSAEGGAAPDVKTTPDGTNSDAQQPFKIQKLHLRIGRVTIIAGDGTADSHQIIDQELNFVFEAQGVTEKNFGDTVSNPLGKAALQKAGQVAPQLIMDLAREKLRRSITEKLQTENQTSR